MFLVFLFFSFFFRCFPFLIMFLVTAGHKAVGASMRGDIYLDCSLLVFVAVLVNGHHGGLILSSDSFWMNSSLVSIF